MKKVVTGGVTKLKVNNMLYYEDCAEGLKGVLSELSSNQGKLDVTQINTLQRAYVALNAAHLILENPSLISDMKKELIL